MHVAHAVASVERVELEVHVAHAVASLERLAVWLNSLVAGVVDSSVVDERDGGE